MNFESFDTAVVAGGIPLGAFVSVVLSFLKSQFGLSSQQARSIVALGGLGYAIVVGISQGLASSGDIAGIALNAVSSGVALIFGSEGFYQWLGKRFEAR